MKKLSICLVLPLTIITFITCRKWWYALIIDATDEMMTGFPLIFACRGLHTSLSTQYFLSEMLFNFLIYFLFCYALVYLIHHFVRRIKISIIASLFFWLPATFLGGVGIFTMSMPENLFYLHRPFPIEVMDSGYHFIWTKPLRPVSYQYYPKAK